jgi:beta-galactosidase
LVLYLGGKQVVSKSYSGRGVDQKFFLLADDSELHGDGADATRVVLRLTDGFGATRPYANDSISLELEGPADNIGENPFSLIGGTGAVWIRAKQEPGEVCLTAKHPRLGSQTAKILVRAAPTESV